MQHLQAFPAFPQRVQNWPEINREAPSASPTCNFTRQKFCAKLSLKIAMADVFSKTKRSWVMSRIRGKNTAPEKLVRRLLHSHGYRFRLHRGDLPGVPDIVLPKYRTAIFVQGCFWHGHNCKDGRRPSSNTAYWNEKLRRNAERDVRNLRKLRRMGWRCLVVWACQLTNDTCHVENRILRAFRSQG